MSKRPPSDISSSSSSSSSSSCLITRPHHSSLLALASVVATEYRLGELCWESLSPEIQFLILTACGHTIFAWNCVSRQLNAFIADSRVFAQITLFRFYYHLGYRTLHAGEMLRGQRLVQLQPRAYKLEALHADRFDYEALSQCSTSLTALAIRDELLDLQLQGNYDLTELLIGGGLAKLTHLRYLELRELNLRHIEEGEALSLQLAQLTNLEGLHLYTDQWLYYADYLPPLTNLRQLDLQTRDRPMASELTHLCQLESVRLAPWQISHHLTALSNLQHLAVHCLPEDLLMDPSDVRGLDLSFLSAIVAVTYGDLELPGEMNRSDAVGKYYWSLR